MTSSRRRAPPRTAGRVLPPRRSGDDRCRDGDPAVRSVRGPVRSRDAHARARRAHAGVCGGTRGSRVPERPRVASLRLLRTSDSALPRAAPGRGRRARGRLPEARGPQPHGRAQDQQHAGAGPAREANGEAPHHRGDRSGTARRGDRHCVRALRSGLRGLHGRGGRRPPGAERVPHGAARRGRPAGGLRYAHAQGCDQRGDPRLGHERRDDALHHRLGGRDRIRFRGWSATSRPSSEGRPASRS